MRPVIDIPGRLFYLFNLFLCIRQLDFCIGDLCFSICNFRICLTLPVLIFYPSISQPGFSILNLLYSGLDLFFSISNPFFGIFNLTLSWQNLIFSGFQLFSCRLKLKLSWRNIRFHLGKSGLHLLLSCFYLRKTCRNLFQCRLRLLQSILHLNQLFFQRIHLTFHCLQKCLILLYFCTIFCNFGIDFIQLCFLCFNLLQYLRITGCFILTL